MSDDKATRIRQFAQDRICLLEKLAEIDRELDANRLKLLTLLTQIAVEQARPLTLVEFVSLAWETDFHTEARCYSGLIYAAIRKLVALGILEQDQVTHRYRYVGQPVGL